MLFGAVEFPHRIRWLAPASQAKPKSQVLGCGNFEGSGRTEKLALPACGMVRLMLFIVAADNRWRSSRCRLAPKSSLPFKHFWRSLESGSGMSPSVPRILPVQNQGTRTLGEGPNRAVDSQVFLSQQADRSDGRRKDWMHFSVLAFFGSCCLPRPPIRLCPSTILLHQQVKK